MSYTITDSQGTEMVFGGKQFLATKISVQRGGGSSGGNSKNQIDVSHLGLSAGTEKVYQAPPLKEPADTSANGVVATVTVDFLDLMKPTMNTDASLDLGEKLKITGTAQCVEYSLDASVNDVIRGQAKFEMSTITDG
jgi:hypothetical protein